MNVLIVDDEMLALRLLCKTVREVLTDARIFDFQFGDDALACARENPIDVAFLDISLRETSGLKVAKELKEIRGITNIIFVTAYSDYALDAMRIYASDYLLKPATREDVKNAMEHLRNPIVPAQTDLLQIRCFGNFGVFYKGQPVYFERKRSMELLAYLIDRRCVPVSCQEIASILWEDGVYDNSRNKQIHTYISTLRKGLSSIGFNNILIHKRDAFSLKRDQIQCDFYDFLDGDPQAVNSYLGEYMTQYSWAEFTNAGIQEQSFLD